MVKSFTFNKGLAMQTYELFKKDPTNRFAPLHDLKTLDAQLGDCAFGLNDTSAKHGITCFQGLQLPLRWENSSIAKTDITPIGIVAHNRGYRTSHRMTEAAVLDGEIGIIVDGQFKVKNTAHMGMDAVWKQTFPDLATRNVWPDMNDQTWIRAIEDGGQHLAAGDQIVLDMFTFDTQATLANGAPAEYMNPTNPNYWQIYKYTLPPYLRNKPRFVLRYRKMTEYEEQSLTTMYNTLETLRHCISIVQTAKTLNVVGLETDDWKSQIVDRFIDMSFHAGVFGIIDNLREKIYGVNWPRFTVKEGGAFDKDVIISVSPF